MALFSAYVGSRFRTCSVPKAKTEVIFKPKLMPKLFSIESPPLQFREFIRTTSSTSLPTSAAVAAANPLPALDWVDRRDLWELVRKKETGMYARGPGRQAGTATGASNQLFARHPAIQERMRAVLFDWLIEVSEKTEN